MYIVSVYHAGERREVPIGHFHLETDAALCASDFNVSRDIVSRLEKALDREYATDEEFKQHLNAFISARDQFDAHFGVNWIWTAHSFPIVREVKADYIYTTIQWIENKGTVR